MEADRKTIIYAPNVRSGGGLVLLQALLENVPPQRQIIALLDARAKQTLKLSAAVDYVWVNPGLIGRFTAELRLRRIGGPNDCILCFHGLPPLFVLGRQVVVFVQNRLMFSTAGINRMKLRTRLRTQLERLMARILRGHVSRYIVQTPSMAHALTRWHGQNPLVRIAPFVGHGPAPQPAEATRRPRWDFVYIADGEAHKNHRMLLKAWVTLAAEGVKPTLALTLGPGDRELWARIEQECRLRGLCITNLGQRRHDEIWEVYKNSRSLIFPSLYESFGLPLIEAGRMGLPIVASELDFVRDVCNPLQTFDPDSAVSIARAVRRFLGNPGQDRPILAGGEWLEHIFAPEDATSQACLPDVEVKVVIGDLTGPENKFASSPMHVLLFER